jgi:hypothetical protein
MCDPVTMTVMAVGQAGASYMAKKSAADQQEAAQMVATEQERDRAGKENTAIRARQSQQRDALAAEMEEGSRRANKAISTAVVSSAESGITGRAASLVEQDVNVQHARYNQSLVNQRMENDYASQLQTEEARMRNKSNLQQINKPIEEPSVLGLVTDVVGGAISANTAGINFKNMSGLDPTFGNLTGLSGMLGLNTQGGSQPVAGVAQVVPENTRVPTGLPNWSEGATASGELLPTI